jgi:hypothetical protein
MPDVVTCIDCVEVQITTVPGAGWQSLKVMVRWGGDQDPSAG